MDVFDSINAIMYDPIIEQDNEPRYRAPQHSEALKVWRACGFLEEENESFIYNNLYMWAETNRLLYKLSEESTELHIAWISDTNVTYKFKWTTFLKWFELSCIRV